MSTAELAIPSSDRIAVAATTTDTQTTALIAKADAAKVESRDDVAAAAEIGKEIRETGKAFDSAWREMFGPFEEHLDELKKRLVSEPKKALQAAYSRMTGKVTEFEVGERRRAQEEAKRREEEEKERRRKADELAKAGMAPETVRKYVPPAAAQPAPTVHVGPTRAASGAGFTTKDEPFVVVTDKAKVPLVFLEVNEKAIIAAWKSGSRDIPGVTIELRPKTRGL